MDINKALRKQKKSYKIFMLSMCFIFFILPIALYGYGSINFFFISYLVFIEAMILLAMIATTRNNKLSYKYENNKLKIFLGGLGKQYLLFCDKIALVHTEKTREEIEIIIVTSVKFRNKDIRPINIGFHKRYPYAADRFIKLKRRNPENQYYYLVIRKGGYLKYPLLDLIYKNSAKAEFSEEAIENVKIARGVKEF